MVMIVGFALLVKENDAEGVTLGKSFKGLGKNKEKNSTNLKITKDER